MCGIAGILRVHSSGQAPPPAEVAIPEAWLDILDESIKHRGPDGQGRFRDRAVRPDGTVVDVALVHRRLAIIDPACGHQPMVSERGRDQSEGLIAVVFNGCIYNHRDLRKELQAAGHRFKTDHSDTEVLVHGWREWRDGCLDRLEGMFAVAIWDRASGELILARDRCGEKPLLGLTAKGGGVQWTAFCSSQAGLSRILPGMGPELGTLSLRRHLGHWLRLGFGPAAPGEWSFEVSPSSFMRVGSHPLTHTPYGPLARLDTTRVPARNAILNAESAEALLAAAVEHRLEADVPLGCFLSGGVDSSLIAFFARRKLGSLRTFTVRMPDARSDESGFAESAAKSIGSIHTTLDCHSTPASDLMSAIESLGLPFGDSSLLPTTWVSRAAREYVRVCLSGDGGDELFCGYERHGAARVLGWARGLLWALPPPGAGANDPKSRIAKLERLRTAAVHEGFVELISIFPTPLLRALLPDPEAFPLTAWSRDGLSGALAIDRWYYLPGDLMRKSDTASMSIALEVRAPFLDSALLSACEQATASSLMPRGQRKGLLRQVARKYLPADIVDRPKQGFAIPIGEWFRSDYGGMKTLLLDHLNSAEPWGPPSLGIDLNMKFVRQMLDEHLGTGPSGLVRRDHSQRLYMLLVLSIWAKWLGRL